jgi:hypothetical protein
MHFGKNSPGEGKIAAPKNRATVYQRLDMAEVSPTGGALNYKEGDTVDILAVGRQMSFSGNRGTLVTRAGRGVVVGHAGKRLVIQITDVWADMRGGEAVAKAATFEPFYCDRLAVADKGIRAGVVLRLDNTPVPYLQQYIVIDKGSDAGVRIGDFFKVMDKESPNKISEPIVEAQAVSVTPAASTLQVLKIYKGRLDIGDEAFLSLRATAK